MLFDTCFKTNSFEIAILFFTTSLKFCYSCKNSLTVASQMCLVISFSVLLQYFTMSLHSQFKRGLLRNIYDSRFAFTERNLSSLGPNKCQQIFSVGYFQTQGLGLEPMYSLPSSCFCLYTCCLSISCKKGCTQQGDGGQILTTRRRCRLQMVSA